MGHDRPVHHIKPALLLHRMRRNTRPAELGHNKPAVPDQFGKSTRGHLDTERGSAKGSFASRAPDIDPVGVKNQNPSILLG